MVVVLVLVHTSFIDIYDFCEEKSKLTLCFKMKKQNRSAMKGKMKGGITKKNKGQKLTKKQKKLDVNGNNRIDGQDFKLLRKKNSKKK